MKIIFRLFLAAFILVMGVLVNAQPPCPTCPPGSGGGGGGGTTPGGPASPIDMYVYILAIAAILFIVLYANKIKKKQIV
ncbi:hypothetical protein [Kaistella antarctica]|uniref:Signal peptidase n=1 Tax=Kaistella antarctica TaxID=266748 RepID=A0ABR4TXC6_9FLAO|nr:hypothetical protein [Kaistella antarctica]KEY18534.1 hypothetical protein HY04_08460 [Kaistella antarctica]SEV86716.1 hypothetical protein SAMN05421765_0906 [Kaistella antarctica]